MSPTQVQQEVYRVTRVPPGRSQHLSINHLEKTKFIGEIVLTCGFLKIETLKLEIPNLRNFESQGGEGEKHVSRHTELEGDDHITTLSQPRVTLHLNRLSELGVVTSANGKGMGRLACTTLEPERRCLLDQLFCLLALRRYQIKMITHSSPTSSIIKNTSAVAESAINVVSPQLQVQVGFAIMQSAYQIFKGSKEKHNF
ncbi:uncharacterized protein LOC143027380 [Oratosquilla oratoria]|uniref:uncharacterized protein LOC143027380 n=1 Tax=Oratosquilla oratoria TaxID=337810 RepID=UPI003F757EC9